MRNENIKQRLKVYISQRGAGMRDSGGLATVWPRKEARPRLRRKTDSGDGTTRDKKARKTETEMDGLCQLKHESHRNDYRRGP